MTKIVIFVAKGCARSKTVGWGGHRERPSKQFWHPKWHFHSDFPFQKRAVPLTLHGCGPSLRAVRLSCK